MRQWCSLRKIAAHAGERPGQVCFPERTPAIERGREQWAELGEQIVDRPGSGTPTDRRW
jgi:hypothetical protein